MKKEIKPQVIVEESRKSAVVGIITALICMIGTIIGIITLSNDPTNVVGDPNEVPKVEITTVTSTTGTTTPVATTTSVTTTPVTTTTPVVTTTESITTTMEQVIVIEENKSESQPIVVQQEETPSPIIQTEPPTVDNMEETQQNISEDIEITIDPQPEYQEPVVEETPSMTYLGNLRITGYVATGNPTASGEYPYVGGVAMSTSYGLPYGTKIYIEGLGTYVLNDCGCRSGVVDVFCNTVSECYNLTSYADVYIVN